MDGQFTYQQAADPSSPGELLAEIAYRRPDLRPAVARNPATYAGLLEWLAQLGDPAVDAALRTRSAPGGGTMPGPGQPPLTPMAPGPAGAGPGPGAGGYYPPGLSPTDAPVGRVPQGPPGYSAGVPGGPAPAPPRTSRAWIWIVVAVAVVVIIGAVIAGIVVIRTVTQVAEDVIPEISQPGGYGDDAALDSLWDSCEAGGMAACDELYRQSSPGTQYHEFGDTCGGRTEGGTWCDPASAG